MHTKEEAIPHLRPYSAILSECWVSALEELDILRQHKPEIWAKTSSKSIAHLFNDLLTAEIHLRFIGICGTVVVRKHGRTALSINSELYIRFKKLNKKGRPYYSDTRDARKCFEMQESIDGMAPNVTTLINGYTVSEFGNVGRIVVTCPVAKHNAWCMELEDLTNGQGERNLFGPVEPPKPPSVVTKPELMPKKSQDGTADGV